MYILCAKKFPIILNEAYTYIYLYLEASQGRPTAL